MWVWGGGDGGGGGGGVQGVPARFWLRHQDVGVNPRGKSLSVSLSLPGLFSFVSYF